MRQAGWATAMQSFQYVPSQSLPVGNQNCVAKSKEACAQTHKGGSGQARQGLQVLTAFLSPFRSGVFNMSASNTSSVSLRTYSRTGRQRGHF